MINEKTQFFLQLPLITWYQSKVLNLPKKRQIFEGFFGRPEEEPYMFIQYPTSSDKCFESVYVISHSQSLGGCIAYPMLFERSSWMWNIV